MNVHAREWAHSFPFIPVHFRLNDPAPNEQGLLRKTLPGFEGRTAGAQGQGHGAKMGVGVKMWCRAGVWPMVLATALEACPARVWREREPWTEM